MIADSGATKTEWALVSENGVQRSLTTKGFNPYYYQKEGFVSELKSELKEKLPELDIQSIFFYGAGCSTTENCRLVSESLSLVFPGARIEVGHDLYAAGLALFGRKKGIACILGTGSNSCLWDNKKIIANVPSLGFMLGDEGSGTHIGKLLLKGVLLGEADELLVKKFYETFDLDFSKALDRVYKTPAPNLFYSSLSPFVRDNLRNPFCRKVVESSFTAFVRRYLSRYADCRSLTVSFTGSVAFHFQDVLKTVLEANGMQPGSILSGPMEGLVAFHMEEH